MKEECEPGSEAAGHSRLAVIIVVGRDDIGALEASVSGLAENSMLPGLHVCFLTPESMDAGDETAKPASTSAAACRSVLMFLPPQELVRAWHIPCIGTKRD